ncbi:hypothetical protein F2Q69_00006327 [Brassica cretica]|uniref:Uncharacterized protein n=1 Tax=Brassica cretica TaxID=69181 RepID=A0A8S9P014_BRACR|nr:hypothetical protein F2Q69_00006327 [Brassica cretica]
MGLEKLSFLSATGDKKLQLHFQAHPIVVAVTLFCKKYCSVHQRYGGHWQGRQRSLPASSNLHVSEGSTPKSSGSRGINSRTSRPQEDISVIAGFQEYTSKITKGKDLRPAKRTRNCRTTCPTKVLLPRNCPIDLEGITNGSTEATGQSRQQPTFNRHREWVDRVHSPARRIFELHRPRDQLGHPPSRTGMAELDRQDDQLGGWLAGSNTRLARPSAELDQFSSPDGRAGSNTRPARPSAELDQSSSADGRARSNTRPA